MTGRLGRLILKGVTWEKHIKLLDEAKRVFFVFSVILLFFPLFVFVMDKFRLYPLLFRFPLPHRRVERDGRIEPKI